MAGISSLEEMPWTANLQEKMRYIFDTGFLSDATLYLGIKKQKVKAHRFVLEFASPIFYRDFQQARNNELIIHDVDPEIFIKFLRYIYLGECEAAVEKCIPLLDIATKYKAQNLMDFCAEKLKGNISLQNVTTLFHQAMKFGYQPLTEVTLAYFCKNANLLIKTEHFLELREEYLSEILKSDDLSVKSELDLFSAVLRWGEAECQRQKLDPEVPENLQKVLAKVLGLIRFPNMDAEEFTLKVATRKLLGSEELISLLSHFNLSIEKREKISKLQFNATPRKYSNISVVYKTELYTVSRGLKFTNWHWVDNPFDSLRLEVNKHICLVGLKLFVNPDFREDVRNDFSNLSCTIRIEILPSETCFHKTRIKEFNFFKTIHLEPVELEPNSIYQITVSYRGTYKICWSDGSINNYRGVFGAKDLQSLCYFEYEDKKGTEKVQFQFSRGDSSEWPLNEGIIKDFIFKIEE